jgi:hypothetical protein
MPPAIFITRSVLRNWKKAKKSLSLREAMISYEIAHDINLVVSADMRNLCLFCLLMPIIMLTACSVVTTAASVTASVVGTTVDVATTAVSTTADVVTSPVRD